MVFTKVLVTTFAKGDKVSGNFRERLSNPFSHSLGGAQCPHRLATSAFDVHNRAQGVISKTTGNYVLSPARSYNCLSTSRSNPALGA